MDMEHSEAGEVPDDLKEATDPTYKVSTTSIIEADHMDGMKGATAEIESSEETTVYIVDYMLTKGGKEVNNHKWVTEDELSTE